MKTYFPSTCMLAFLFPFYLMCSLLSRATFLFVCLCNDQLNMLNENFHLSTLSQSLMPENNKVYLIVIGNHLDFFLNLKKKSDIQTFNSLSWW